MGFSSILGMAGGSGGSGGGGGGLSSMTNSAGSSVSSPFAIGAGIYQTIQGAKEERDAKRALRNYKRQELTNVGNGLQVSTLGSDLQREEQARLASGQIGALQEAGTRGLIGGLGRVEAGNQRVMQQTGADLDAQQKVIDQIRAEDQARIRAMQENREISDLSALSSQLQAGKQDKYTGMANTIQGISMSAGSSAPTNTATNAPSNKFNVTGYAPDNTQSMYQSPYYMKDAPQSGYATNFNFPNYQQSAFGPQQAYGVFNQYPYSPYGPKNQ